MGKAKGDLGFFPKLPDHLPVRGLPGRGLQSNLKHHASVWFIRTIQNT